jgi:hypothetical protein
MHIEPHHMHILKQRFSMMHAKSEVRNRIASPNILCIELMYKYNEREYLIKSASSIVKKRAPSEKRHYIEIVTFGSGINDPL